MSVFKRGQTFWFKFVYCNRLIRESAKTASKTVAKQAEQKRRRELEEGFNNLGDNRKERVQTLAHVAALYLDDYKVRHRSITFAEYAVGNVCRHLGKKLLVDISAETVKQYQTSRRKEKAAPKTVNEEVGFLLRLLGERGDAIRVKLKRAKALKLKTGPAIGKAFSAEQKDNLLKAATPVRSVGSKSQKGTRSPYILPALALALNAGLRDAEIRSMTWGQVDFEKQFLTVGKSKSDAGEGRTIPLNQTLLTALQDHSRWYAEKFGLLKPAWYLFAGRVGKPALGKKRLLDPTKHVTSLKTAWQNVRVQAGVQGRWHDARHTLITELSEGGAGDQTIMDIAGHVSRQMLARYSHIRMEAKRKALDAIGTKATLERADAAQTMSDNSFSDGVGTTMGTIDSALEKGHS